MSAARTIAFPDGDTLRTDPRSTEEKDLLRRLAEFSQVIAKDYGAQNIEWWTDSVEAGQADPTVALYFKTEMPDGIVFEASISPEMYVELITDAPLDDFFEHMHRELSLRVDEWKRGYHDPKPPDVVEHVIAFREWTVDWDKLTIGAIGIGRDVLWKGVEWDAAICRAPGRSPNAPFGHSAPHPHCECGFYALHKFPDTQPQGYGRADSGRMDKVWGVVQAKGRMEVHKDGVRAEYMRPVMLAVPEPSQWYVPEDPTNPAGSGRMVSAPERGAIPCESEGAQAVRKLAKHLGLDAVTFSYVKTKASEYGTSVPADLRPS